MSESRPPLPPAAAFTTSETGRVVKGAMLKLVLVVVVLYFGREFFIPIALSVLISFLLAPLVMRLERMHLGRVLSVIIATLLAFSVFGGIGAIVGTQMIELANDLPGYKEHLQKKLDTLKAPRGGAFSRAADTVKELTNDFSKAAPPQPGPLAPSADVPAQPSQLYVPNLGGAPAPATPGEPVKVSVVDVPGNSFETLQRFINPLLGPLGTAAVVVIFVVFMLLEREDLRDRVIHLVGRGHLRLTTQALDEATHRVSRYLLAQLIVNVTYGIPIAIGLAFIGVPNPFLWGLLATVLRFIPYIGPWIASFFPLVLSLAVSDSWFMPLEVLGLYLVIELISNNVVEPWLYGASTGLSPMAVIVAAAFWTWLWGTIGLLLATPLTVCIAVLGKYIPQLSFLDVMLGDKPPISPEDRFYQRLLAGDEDEVSSISENYCEKNGLLATFDTLLVPAMRLADEDFHHGDLPEASRNRIYELVRNLIADLGEDETITPVLPADMLPIAVCVPASDYADEIIGMMLGKILAQNNEAIIISPSKYLASEMMEAVAAAPTRLVCVSVLPPGSTRHAIYVSRRLRDRFPEARILVGMWAEPPGDDRRLQRFRTVKVDGVFTSLQGMIKEILATGRVTPAVAVEEKK